MNMTVTEQQEIVAEVLIKIKQFIDNDAIVAGGAPRNWKEGKLANDIDLYMRSHCDRVQYRLISQIAHAVGVEELSVTQSSDMSMYDFTGNLKISRILGVNYKGVKFQFIVLDSNVEYRDFKQQVVGHMDVGLNRIYCDWYYSTDIGCITETLEHKEDFDNKKLTLYPKDMTESQLKHCMENHLPKMIKYYPDYQVTIKN